LREGLTDPACKLTLLPSAGDLPHGLKAAVAETRTDLLIILPGKTTDGLPTFYFTLLRCAGGEVHMHKPLRLWAGIERQLYLLWIVDDTSGQQWLSFVDPKGIKLVDLSDPKLQLYREIKDIEQEVGDPMLTLNAFILSNTAFENLLNLSDRETQAALEERHLLFMNGGRDRCLGQLITKTLEAA
jgi:hypothetical protein